jgi:hypothetical protein
MKKKKFIKNKHSEKEAKKIIPFIIPLKEELTKEAKTCTMKILKIIALLKLKMNKWN